MPEPYEGPARVNSKRTDRMSPFAVRPSASYRSRFRAIARRLTDSLDSFLQNLSKNILSVNALANLRVWHGKNKSLG